MMQTADDDAAEPGDLEDKGFRVPTNLTSELNVAEGEKIEGPRRPARGDRETGLRQREGRSVPAARPRGQVRGLWWPFRRSPADRARSNLAKFKSESGSAAAGNYNYTGSQGGLARSSVAQTDLVNAPGAVDSSSLSVDGTMQVT